MSSLARSFQGGANSTSLVLLIYLREQRWRCSSDSGWWWRKVSRQWSTAEWWSWWWCGILSWFVFAYSIIKPDQRQHFSAFLSWSLAHNNQPVRQTVALLQYHFSLKCTSHAWHILGYNLSMEYAFMPHKYTKTNTRTLRPSRGGDDDSMMMIHKTVQFSIFFYYSHSIFVIFHSILSRLAQEETD